MRLRFLLEVQVIYKQMHLFDLRKAISVFKAKLTKAELK